MYLPPNQFESLYPEDEVIISSGGRVYYTEDGNNVVKADTINERYILSEIFFLTSISHPNIVEILNFTFADNEFKFAMKRGMTIRSALIAEKITINEVITDVMSALLFLHSNGIAHGDIKLDNIIYLDGRAILIDFGLARRGYRVENTYYFSGKCYTITYRDPEFYSQALNDIVVELYSVAALVYFHRYPEKNNICFPGYFNFDFVEGDLRELLEELQAPIEWRKSVFDLISHPAIIKERIIGGKINLLPNRGITSFDRDDVLDFIDYYQGQQVIGRPLILSIKNYIRYNKKVNPLSFIILSCWCYGESLSLPIPEDEYEEALAFIPDIVVDFNGRFFDYSQWDTITTLSQFNSSLSAFFNPAFDPEKFYLFPMTGRYHKLILNNFVSNILGKLVETHFSEGVMKRDIIKKIVPRPPDRFTIKKYCKYVLKTSLPPPEKETFRKYLLQLSEQFENYEMFNRISPFI